ncbi:hypothetical protein AAHA92_05809 [Salvia divinorum]|uniref:Uncharacterized protein n=1 Tax=Salvia divinorum TaxID=28513 RepID=A0ABD1I3L9_SALDI
MAEYFMYHLPIFLPNMDLRNRQHHIQHPPQRPRHHNLPATHLQIWILPPNRHQQPLHHSLLHRLPNNRRMYCQPRPSPPQLLWCRNHLQRRQPYTH